jgi:hypothetical protein
VAIAEMQVKIGWSYVDTAGLDGLAVPGMLGGEWAGSTEYAG